MKSHLVMVGLGLGLVACQDDVTTPFPPGLEPLEDNYVPDTDVREEVLRTKTGAEDGNSYAHGRGYVFVSPAALWEATRDPDAMVARCRTDVQTVTPQEDDAYEYSFLVAYTVNDILTVQWTDEWRYGTITGTREEPELGMIKHQKIQGSDFIELSEGTIQLIATDDPDITELAFVEHLDAISGNSDDLREGMQDNYDRLLALVHGLPRPSCP